VQPRVSPEKHQNGGNERWDLQREVWPEDRGVHSILRGIPSKNGLRQRYPAVEKEERRGKSDLELRDHGVDRWGELDGSHDGDLLAGEGGGGGSQEVVLDASDEMGDIKLDLHEDVKGLRTVSKRREMEVWTNFDRSDCERYKAAVTIVNQQICANLFRCEVIYAAGTVGDIRHDDHLRVSELGGPTDRLTFVLAKRSKISEMTSEYMSNPSGNWRATSLASSCAEMSFKRGWGAPFWFSKRFYGFQNCNSMEAESCSEKKKRKRQKRALPERSPGSKTHSWWSHQEFDSVFSEAQLF
jgi:hypothetical protein